MINFVMEMDKVNFPEAIEHLAKKTGLELVYEQSSDRGGSGEEEARRRKKDELFELNTRISGTFHHFLLKTKDGQKIKQYIINRGINNEMIERFTLGYSPHDRYWLHNFLLKKGYSGEFLAESGLFSSRHNRASLFSGRLIFPIADRQGRTVAFGGRVIEASRDNSGESASTGHNITENASGIPKYINSPEIEIYKKGETLYAINLALGEIRRTKTAYIAEGYLDVIALHQAGISNAVAPLGTAFTDEQAKLLKRWAEEVVFFFDSDNAGHVAAQKGIYTCRRNGLACNVVTHDEKGAGKDSADILKQGTEAAPPKYPADILKLLGPEAAPPKDPADILKLLGPEAAPPKDPTDILKLLGPEAEPPKDPADILKLLGPEALQKRAKNFINDFEYLLLRARLHSGVGNFGEGSVHKKAQGVAFLFPYMDLLDSEISRTSCIEIAADAFALLPAQVAEEYRSYTSRRRSRAGDSTRAVQAAESGQKYPEHDEEKSRPVRVNDELSLLIAVAVNYVSSRGEKSFAKFRSSLEISEIEDTNAKELFIALEECIRYGETGMNELLARISAPELKKNIIERSASGEFSVNLERLISDGVNKIRVKRLERKQQDIIIRLRSSKKKTNENMDAGEMELEVRELLSEKMRIDNELYTLRQGR